MAGSTPTPKARALGAALKAAREKHGEFSQRKLAKEIGRDPGLLSRWESGERIPKPSDVTQILFTLGINGEQAADIMDMTTGTDQPHWLAITLPEQRQQLAALIDFERTATKITQIAPLLVPGILQTGDYIRAMMSAGTVEPTEINTRVAVRIGRREVITRRNPAQIVAVLGEATLRHIVGSAEIQADQLRYLLELADFPNVDIRVAPFTSGWTPLLEGTFALIDSEEAPPVVYLASRRSTLFLHEPEDVEIYQHAGEWVQSVALSSTDSRGFITEVIGSLEKMQ